MEFLCGSKPLVEAEEGIIGDSALFRFDRLLALF